MKTMKSILIALLSIITLQVTIAQASYSETLASLQELTEVLDENRKASDIILSYVEDYRNDRFAAEPILFGIEVPDQGKWTVQVTGKKKGDTWEVLLTDGLPQKPTFVYNIEFETLQAIDQGIINALTAQGKAFAGDYTPMSVQNMDGFEPTAEADAKINPFSFHFWTRGFPEIIPFGEGTTRRAHGSNFTVFYYETGIRTAWYRIMPEERVRDDAREQAAPFPMIVVAIKGTTEGEVDGQRVSISEGNTIFIPANVMHKWWNETDEAAEAVLIMFGKGA
ncbi:cupin domain-containing protein [Aureisphaera galaxeae]|uniref:cupin domain-containing protein n=1 Tax=Aureisphaera galaxeae TaxID=1538023 RepID=UPI002351031F|nr:cupin domain-containing protein [Aureisphaera galaxeae]MDC8004688.1 cupin domain-containing protein [Aureisphaera galaxeae]